MTKIRIDVTVDLEAWQEARKRNINVSEACDSGLKEVLGMEELIEKATEYSSTMQEALEEMTKGEKEDMMRRVREGKGQKAGWAKWIYRRTGVEVNPKEIIKVFGGK